MDFVERIETNHHQALGHFRPGTGPLRLGDTVETENHAIQNAPGLWDALRRYLDCGRGSTSRLLVVTYLRFEGLPNLSA